MLAIMMSDYFLQYNGVDLLSLYGKDALAYGRVLLDHLFTKQEQKSSLFHKTHSNKSMKPTLEKERVELLYGEKCCVVEVQMKLLVLDTRM